MTETIILSAIGAAGLGLAALGVLAWARKKKHGTRPDRSGGAPPPAADREHSLARYQPMFRLLEGSDSAFLRRYQNSSHLVTAWERVQRKVIRMYLRELAEEFAALHREARIQVARSAEAPQGAMLRLLRQQLAFWRALLWVEIRLSLGGAGASRINPEALVAAFEMLERELSRGPRLAQDQPA